jgi:hypothetical protein
VDKIMMMKKREDLSKGLRWEDGWMRRGACSAIQQSLSLSIDPSPLPGRYGVGRHPRICGGGSGR